MCVGTLILIILPNILAVCRHFIYAYFDFDLELDYNILVVNWLLDFPFLD